MFMVFMISDAFLFSFILLLNKAEDDAGFFFFFNVEIWIQLRLTSISPHLASWLPGGPKLVMVSSLSTSRQ